MKIGKNLCIVRIYLVNSDYT